MESARGAAHGRRARATVRIPYAVISVATSHRGSASLIHITCVNVPAVTCTRKARTAPSPVRTVSSRAAPPPGTAPPREHRSCTREASRRRPPPAAARRSTGYSADASYTAPGTAASSAVLAAERGRHLQLPRHPSVRVAQGGLDAVAAHLLHGGGCHRRQRPAPPSPPARAGRTRACAEDSVKTIRPPSAATPIVSTPDESAPTDDAVEDAAHAPASTRPARARRGGGQGGRRAADGGRGGEQRVHLQHDAVADDGPHVARGADVRRRVAGDDDHVRRCAPPPARPGRRGPGCPPRRRSPRGGPAAA